MTENTSEAREEPVPPPDPTPVVQTERSAVLGWYVSGGAVAVAIPALSFATYVTLNANVDHLNGASGHDGETLAYAVAVAVVCILVGAVIGLVAAALVWPFARRCRSVWTCAIPAAIAPIIVLGGLYVWWMGAPERLGETLVNVLIVCGIGSYFMSAWHEIRARRGRPESSATRPPPMDVPR